MTTKAFFLSAIDGKTLFSLDETKAAVPVDGSETIVDKVLKGLREELRDRGDRLAIIEAVENQGHLKQQCYLSELEPAMTSLANALVAFGVEHGDKVQIALHNNCDFFIPVVGSWMAGAVTSLSDPSMSVAVMREQLNVIKPKVIFCSRDIVDNVIQAASDDILPKIVVVNGSTMGKMNLVTMEDFSKGYSSTNIPTNHTKAKLEEDAIIFWSSGTTGNPKGIRNSQKSILANMAHPRFASYGRNSSFLQTTCMFHAGGFFFCLVNAVRNGVTIITFSLQKYITGNEIFRAVDMHKVTVLMIGSHHGILLASANPPQELDLSSVTIIVPVGAAMHHSFPDELRERFHNAKRIVNAYGSTETGGISSSLNFTKLGALFKGVSAIIRHPKTGEYLGPTEVGEICCKTSGTMSGYINVSPVEAAKAFTEDGFFCTGDLGWYDEDGVLFYQDRLKALIKYKNFHLYPAELENFLQRIPDIVEAGVFGVPDPTVQELISVAVVKKKGSLLTEEDIKAKINNQVEDHKKIRGRVYFVDRLPRNMVGKVIRKKLREVADVKC